LGSLNGNIPRYFLEAHRGSADLGMYAAIASLQQAGNMVMSALGQSVFVPVARAWADRDRSRYRMIVAQVVLMGVALGGTAVVVSAVAGRWLLAALFRPEYGEHAGVFTRLMAVGLILFVTSGQGYVMTAARVLKPQVPLLAASAAVTAAACAFLVPRHGLAGAADAALFGACAHLVGSCFILLAIDRQFTPRLGAMAGTGPAAPRGAVARGKLTA
jgi:O-antigen/teichoic acid export membrane protein